MSSPTIALDGPTSDPTLRWIINNRVTLVCMTILLGACLVLGWEATRLNSHFYEFNQPFYDSVSYHARTHQVMTICREQGLGAALISACNNDTVCLPYIIAAFVALFAEPSRYVGVWIQIAELTFFCWSVWTYFVRVSRLSPWTAIAATAPFLLMRCLYMNNGGLSDFRMDLSLALLFGTTCVWYLIASNSKDRWPYIVLGISCAAACLFRGTASVYIILALGPVVLWDLAFKRRDWSHVQGIATAVAVTMALSFWFYVANFRYLHYYYFIWNTDANAHLPMSESFKHFVFVRDHVGRSAIAYIIVFQLLVVLSRYQTSLFSARTFLSGYFRDLRSIDLRPLWIGIAPALFLMVRGAGLNPFVSMPSVVGLCLFALVPFGQGFALNWWRTALLVFVFGICGRAMFADGWKNHDGDSPNSMAAHQQTLDTIVSDMHSTGLKQANYATTHSFYLNTHSLDSVATFDRKNSRRLNEGIEVDGSLIVADNVMDLSAEADWSRTEGNTDDEKIERLVAKVGQQLDYLVIPTLECAQYMRDHMQHNVVNKFAVQLRERLLSSGDWEVISSDIKNRDDEVVQVYRNRTHYLARQSTNVIR